MSDVDKIVGLAGALGVDVTFCSDGQVKFKGAFVGSPAGAIDALCTEAAAHLRHLGKVANAADEATHQFKKELTALGDWVLGEGE